MAPKSLEPWLAHFLRDEIAAVIEWQRQAVPGIKPDPECRFSDDGSNFRCEIETPPGAAEVQLIEVLTIDDVVTVYVSDGNIKVKARLSPDAVATFEEESGDPIALEVSGDVLQLKNFTIITTPFGPPDGFVQLQIGGLEHRTLLRRTFGNPSPVEENYSVRTLVESIKQLRIPEPSSQHDRDRLHSEADLVPEAAKSSVSATTVSPPPLAIQTQAPAEPKFRGPTLRKDGYEVESGLNLQGPVAPNFLQGKRSAASKKLEDDSHLLGLFRKVKAPASASNAHAVDVKARRLTRPAPQKAASVVSITSTTPANALDSAALVLQDSSAASPRPAVSPARSTNCVAADNASQHEPSSGQPSIAPRRGAVLKDGKSFFAYARIKVPDSQRRLLDSNSWLPALPGKQFPKPNVPRELLMRWNVEAAASDTDLAVSQRSAASQKSAPLQEAMSVSDSDSEGSDTASQEPTPSPSQHWRPKLAAISHSSAISSTMESDGSMEDVSRPSSASPLQPVQPVRPDLPPSSTLGSVVRATPTDGELEVTTPRPLPSGRPPHKRRADELAAPPSKRQSLTPIHAAVTSGPVAGLRHSLPSRPSLSPSPSPASGQRSPQHAPSMLSQCVHDTPAKSFQQDSPRVVMDYVGLVGTEPSLAKSQPSQHPPSRSSQPAPDFRDSAQMKKPSSLSAGRYATTQPKQDGRRATTPLERSSHPVMEQQQARNKFMNQERRKDWLKTLYIPGTDGTVQLGTLQLATVLDEYKKEHPGDSGVRLDDLLLAAQEVYGRTDPSGPDITATTFYVRKPPTPNFSIQAEDRSTVLFRQRIINWIGSRYKWDAKGDCHVSDMWTAYAQHVASKPDAALQAAHGIFHSAVKSVFSMEDKKKYNLWKFTELRDDSKAAMQGAVKTSSSIATSSVVPTKNGLAQSIEPAKFSTPPTCERDIADATRSSKAVSAPEMVDEGSTDRRRRPGLSSNVSMATEDGSSDYTDSIATFCASYLELGSGKSNAFGSAVPGKNTKNNLVDVLRWNL